MTWAPWFDVGRRTASRAAPRRSANNLALVVWGNGPMRRPSLQPDRPMMALTRSGGHAVLFKSSPLWVPADPFAMAYRRDRQGD